MRSLRFLVFGVLLGLVQGSLEKTWGFGGPAPDILLVYIIWLGISGRTGVALWVGFLGGLTRDSVDGMGLLGIHSLAGTVVAYLPEWGKLVLFAGSRYSGLILLALGTLLQALIVLSILQTLATESLWNVEVLYSWFYSVILNSVVWILMEFLVTPRSNPEYGA